MRILVTGANGQLGRALQALAAREGCPATYDFANHAQLDVTNASAIERWLDARPADRLINAAACTAVDRAATDPKAAQAVNAHAPGLLARSCAARGMRLLHVSTDYVFDGTLARPYRESDTPQPINTYGRSKWLGEQAVLVEAPDAIILRTSWVFSAWGSNFPRTLLRLGARQGHLRVISDQIGGPTWAGHVAMVLQRLALCCDTRDIHNTQIDHGNVQIDHSDGPSSGGLPPIPGGIYHFSGEPWISWHAFAQEIFAQAQACGLISRQPMIEAIASKDWPSPEPRPANSRLDNTQLDSLLGPLARDWRAGLGEVLRTWRGTAGHTGT